MKEEKPQVQEIGKKNQTTNNINSQKLTMMSEITTFNNVAILYPKFSNGMHGFVYNVH